MAKYLLTSDKSDGSITYGYTENGMLQFFEVAAQLSPEAHAFILKSLRHGLQQDAFLEWAKQNNYKLTELFEDLSFENWYHKEYGLKRNKDKAAPIYNVLNDVIRQKVFIGTRAYNRYCVRNPWYNKMMPDTFLRNHHYLDEWDKC